MDIRASLPVGPQLPDPATSPETKTAKEFEAVFLGQMTKLMLESVDTGEFSGGAGEDIFRGILAEKLGGVMTAQGGIGLAPSVMDQILKLQGGQDGR